MTAPQAAPTLPTFGEVLRQIPDWVKQNLGKTLLTAAASGVVAYIINVWMMAVRYEGSVTPSGAPVTSDGNFFAGGLFWALLPMVVFGVIGYRRAVGRDQFWKDVRSLPMLLVGLVRRDGASGRVHLLSGAAIALGFGLVVSPAVGAVLGVGLLMAAPTVLGQMFSSLFAQVWHRVGRSVSQTKEHAVPPIMSAAVGMLGGALALTAGFVLSSTMRLVLAIACAVGAFFFAQQSKAIGAAGVVVLVAGGTALAQVLLAQPALADDGGFVECGMTVEAWLENCAGADVVRELARQGGIIAALTGPLGPFFGDLISKFRPPGGGAWWDEPGVHGPPPSGSGQSTDTEPHSQGPGQDPAREPAVVGGPPRLINPDTGEPVIVNDGTTYVGGKPGDVWWDGAWVAPSVAQEAIDKINEWRRREDDYNRRRWEENKAWSAAGTSDRVRTLNEEADKWRRSQEADKAAQTTLDNIKDIARRHGFDDILDRADSSGVVGPDGTIDSDYVNRLRDALRRTMAIDKAFPPGSLDQNWVVDGLTETGKDLIAVGRSVPVRIAVGWASGGSSEVIYQGLGFGERMADAANQAIKNGKNMDFSDFVREGLHGFAEENLPVNTIKNIKEGKTGWWDLASGVAMDGFAILDVRDTGGSIKRTFNDLPNVRNPSEFLDAIHTGEAIANRQAIEAFDGSKPFTKAPEGMDIPPERYSDFGMSPEQVKHAQDVARNADANIQVRPAGREGIDLRAEGHSAKPEFLKNKSINEADTYLGARPEDKGLIGSFPPRLPEPDVLANEVRARKPELDDAGVQRVIDQVTDRARQRFDEFADQQGKIHKLEEQGLATVQNGVVVDMRPGPGQGKGFTADLDLWDATDATTGARLNLDAHNAIEGGLREGPFDAQHGFHTDWKPVGDANVGIDARIRSSHGPGGEGLAQIGPDGKVSVVYDHTAADAAARTQSGTAVVVGAAVETAFGSETSTDQPRGS